jgi:hypothetical protein
MTNTHTKAQSLAEAMPTKEYTYEQLRDAVTDLLDGQFRASEIKAQTGLSDERCVELEEMFLVIVNKQSQTFAPAPKQGTNQTGKDHLQEGLFKAAIAEAGLTDNPKARLVWEKAYECGHAYGMSEVVSHLKGLVK